MARQELTIEDVLEAQLRVDAELDTGLTCEEPDCYEVARYEIASHEPSDEAYGEGAFYYTYVCAPHVRLDPTDRLTKLEARS